MPNYYISSWDAADFTIVSGADPFSDYNDPNNSAIGSIFTVGAAKVLIVSDNDLEFDETDANQEVAVTTYQNNGSASAGTNVDPEYTYRIRPVGGATDGSDDISIYAYEMGIGPGADGIVANARLTPGQQYQVMEITSNGPSPAYSSLYICFAAGARIRTAVGMTPVEMLNRGDLVWTADDGFQPVLWIGRRRLGLRDLWGDPAARPVRITAGALAEGRPRRDIVLSPQHRVLVRSRILQRMFGMPEVLIAAKHLCGWPGVARVRDMVRVEYVHFLLNGHQVVEAEGMLTESLLPGPIAMAALRGDAAAEIAALTAAHGSAARPVRPVLTARRARQLLDRHQRNHQPLVQHQDRVEPSHC